MLSPNHDPAVGHIHLWAHALLYSDSVMYGMATRRISLIPHQLRFWYKRAALTSVSGSARFVNLAFRGIRDISCPFQWFQFGENRTSTAQDMIKRVMLHWCCPPIMVVLWGTFVCENTQCSILTVWGTEWQRTACCWYHINFMFVGTNAQHWLLLVVALIFWILLFAA